MNLKTIQRVVHTTTAMGFAFGVAAFVHRYDLLEFLFAPILSAILVFVAYMFLSRRYDPSLSVFFFVVAAFVFYQAVTLPEKKITSEPFEKLAIRKLSVLVSLVEDYKLRMGSLPLDLKNWALQGDNEFEYCQREFCDSDLTQGNPGLYFIGMRDMSAGEDPVFWYMNDTFNFFSINRRR